MQQWARFAILGAMFVTAYLLILAWQKDAVGARTAWLEALHLAELCEDKDSIQRIQQRLLGKP